MTTAGPLVQLQISLSRVPWRIAPAWSVLAGAFAARTPLDDPALWLRVMAAVVLGDLAWGVLRGYVPTAGAVERDGSGLTAVLPYAQPNAPLSHLVRELAVQGVGWHGALAGLVLALGGALLLGLPALALTLVAIAVTVIAWPLARRGDTPAACFAILDLLLPFVLGLLAAGWNPHAVLKAWQPLLVAAAFTILQWGVLRTAAGAGSRGFDLSVGVLVVEATLVVLMMPGAAAIVAVLLAPALYWLSRPDIPVAGSKGTVARDLTSSAWAAPWLMLALFVAAVALR